MADYTPVALPGHTYTFTASTLMSGSDLVEVTGANSVGKISSASDRAFIGVAAHDAVIGGKVTVVLAAPIHESIADGTVAAGDQLATTSTANRQVKTYAATASAVTLTLPGTYDNTVQTLVATAINTAVNAATNAARAVIGVAITGAADNQSVRWVQW
jgi:hypothetical protein